MVDPKPPKMGVAVIYEEGDGSGTRRPAIVLRTRGDIATVSARDAVRQVVPLMLLEPLPNDYVVDLMTFSPDGTHFQQGVPYHPIVSGPDEAGLGARTWHYPPK